MSTQKRSIETRQRILDTAASSFARAGYNATGVAEICAKAGISKGAFYHHFPSKQSLFVDLIETRLTMLETLITDHVASLSGDMTVPDILRQMAVMTQEIIGAGGGEIPLFLEFWMQATRRVEFQNAMYAPYQTYQALFEELLQRGIEEGSMQPMDTSAGAQLILSTAVGLFLQGLLSPGNQDWGDVVENSINILIDGIMRRNV